MNLSIRTSFWLDRFQANKYLLLFYLVIASSAQALTINGTSYTLSPSSSQVTNLGTLASYGYDNGLNWTDGGNVLKLAATISGTSITFIVAKQDGSAFQYDGIMTIRAGAYYGCVANLNTYAWSYNKGDSFTAATYDLAYYTDEQGGLEAGKVWYAAAGQPTTYCDGMSPNYYSGALSLIPSSSSSSLTFFDGAGSLISPTQSGSGANNDQDRMHPHPDKLSTVVFQFKKDSVCDHVDISSSPTIDALIQAKDWSNEKVSKAFGGTLPMSVPNQGSWTVVAVTSTKPLTQSINIYARCKSSASPVVNNIVTPFSSDESKWITLDNDFFWAGTGSVMSHLGTGTGKTQDVIPVFSSKKSIGSFQWKSSSSCNKLRLSGDNGITLGTGVAVKRWSDSTWTDYSSECSSLPCTIPVPSYDYYIVGIMADASGITGSRLSAGCTN